MQECDNPEFSHNGQLLPRLGGEDKRRRRGSWHPAEAGTSVLWERDPVCARDAAPNMHRDTDTHRDTDIDIHTLHTHTDRHTDRHTYTDTHRVERGQEERRREQGRKKWPVFS